jgi:hypothetical protein
MSRRWIWISALAGALAAIFLGVWLLPDAAAEPAAASLVATTSGPGLVAHAWIETNRPHHGDVVRVRFTFENRGAEPATNIYFAEFTFPGMVPQGDCWNSSLTGPACWTGTGMQRPAFSTVSPGQSATAQANLRMEESVGKVSLTAVYTWQQGGKERMGEISAGPVQVATPVRDALRAFAGIIFEFIKALIIPAALAFLGFLISRRLNRSEFLKTTLTNQLPRLQEYVEQYYMPTTRSLRALLASLEHLSKNTPTDQTRQECLYATLFFLRRMLQLRRGKGGVFFQSHSGEALFRETWIRIQADLNALLGNQWETRASDVQLEDTFDSFQRKRSAKHDDIQAALTKAETDLAAWATGDKSAACRSHLALLIEILHFEANRPFVGSWYVEKKDDGGRAACVKVCQEVADALRDGKLKDENGKLTPLVTVYVEQLSEQSNNSPE